MAMESANGEATEPLGLGGEGPEAGIDVSVGQGKGHVGLGVGIGVGELWSVTGGGSELKGRDLKGGFIGTKGIRAVTVFAGGVCVSHI